MYLDPKDFLLPLCFWRVRYLSRSTRTLLSARVGWRLQSRLAAFDRAFGDCTWGTALLPHPTLRDCA